MSNKIKASKKTTLKISTGDKSKQNLVFTTAILIALIFITLFILNSKNKPGSSNEQTVEIFKNNTDIEKNTHEDANILFELFSGGDKSIENKNKIYEELLKNYDINARDAEGKTILMYAAFYGDKDVLSKIVKHGASINERDSNGRSALHWAAEFGEKDTIEELVKNNIDKSIRDNFGNTAYDIAEFQDHADLATFLK